MSGSSFEEFLPLARVALGGGYAGAERERWVRPLAQLLEASSRGIGHLSLTECPLGSGAPREFFAIVSGNVLLPRNAHFWAEVRDRIEGLHARAFEPLANERVAEALETLLPRERQHADTGHIIFDNGDQRRAAVALIDAPIGVLTGGPGTGKTTCVAVMLAIRKRIQSELLPEQVLLCAPTGKAACRLGESIRGAADRLRLDAVERDFLCMLQPQTLHRALQWSPKPPERGGPFVRSARRPLPQQLVVVDEASMVDLYLMTHLLRALEPRASLLLLGDADQLESVETGGVLAELVQRGAASTPLPAQVRRWAARLGASVPSDPDPSHSAALPASLPGLVVRLRQSYRAKQSPWILELAAIAKPGVRSTVQQFVNCCHKNEPNLRMHATRRGLLSVCREHWAVWRRQSSQWHLLNVPDADTINAHLRQFQLLCGDNAQVQRANQLGLVELWGGAARSERFGLPHGCPVLVTQNRVALGLANGDVGVAIAPAPNQAAQVVAFPGLDAPIPLAQLPTHQPAFAITIHKSQGSEWQRIAIDLPTESEVLDRNLLYTAISRSSGRLDIYADNERALSTILSGSSGGVGDPVSKRPQANGTQLPLFDLSEFVPKRKVR